LSKNYFLQVQIVANQLIHVKMVAFVPSQVVRLNVHARQIGLVSFVKMVRFDKNEIQYYCKR